MFSRPVSSGWKPVPTSSSDPTRPRSTARPSVGSVMRARILSSVDLPAPLRPIDADDLALCDVEGDVLQGPERPRLASRHGRRRGGTASGRRSISDSRQPSVAGSAAPSVYRFPRSARFDRRRRPSDHVRERALGAAEVEEARDEEDEAHDERDEHERRPDGSCAPAALQRKPSITPVIGFSP